MAQYNLEPDSGFTKELMEAGGESLKKCFQCATCSVACPLAPENNPYPRKEMLWASWGVKDKLMSDVDIWLAITAATARISARAARAPPMSWARPATWSTKI